MSVLNELMDELSELGESTFLTRAPGNYKGFLRLYEHIGHAPESSEARTAWRARSVDTWTRQDRLLPGTYSGGICAGNMVSGWGTLPMSPTIVYGHSACMLKTLEGAATMYPQTLYSLAWMDRFPAAEYWAGSYAHGKRFVVLFQKNPLDGPIPGQLEFDTLRCFPRIGFAEPNSADVVVVTATPDDETLLYSEHLSIYNHLSQSHPLLDGLHNIEKRTIKCSASGEPIALVLFQVSLPEFTAINIFSSLWIFPLNGSESIAALYSRLRRVEELRGSKLEIVLPSYALESQPIPTEDVCPVFWAFAPRTSLPVLRRSFRAAFESLLRRYPEKELGAFAEKAASRSCLVGDDWSTT